jgi:hypothetical protein
MSSGRGSSFTDLRLSCSFCLQPGYNRLRSRLEKRLPLLGSPTLPTTGDRAIDAALGVLQTEAEREKVVEAEKEDHYEMAHGINASSTDQHGNLVDADKPQAPVENALKIDDALKILVHNATREFGFAPPRRVRRRPPSSLDEERTRRRGGEVQLLQAKNPRRKVL